MKKRTVKKKKTAAKRQAKRRGVHVFSTFCDQRPKKTKKQYVVVYDTSVRVGWIASIHDSAIDAAEKRRYLHQYRNTRASAVITYDPTNEELGLAHLLNEVLRHASLLAYGS